jgi:putative alpha-1,2-mannosidase
MLKANVIFKLLSFLLLTLDSFFCFAQQSNISYVDPFIGTTKSKALTNWGGNGGTYPGAVAPSGNIQISPETRVTGAKGYDYSDQSIYFFSCYKHLSGFPEGSWGQIFVMPVQENKVFELGKYNRAFSHREEQATPGYYKVVFNDNKTVVEATAGTRTGILKITFAASVIPQLFVGAMGDIQLNGSRNLQGSLGNTVVNLSEEITKSEKVSGGVLLTFKKEETVKFIEIKISTSTVSFEGAQRNIDAEVGQLSFESFKERTRKEWNTQLSTVDLKDPSLANKKVFFTALYHSLLIPWVISDVDGQYRGADKQIHKTSGKYEYGGFSPWDTFRSLHPLLSLLYPEKQKDVILSMLNIYNQTGFLPTESMTGNHAVPIIVDSYLKGITGFDPKLAYTAMKKSIMDSPFVKNDMEIYHQLGYVPFSRSESVTRTVEYAYDDWSLSQYAKLIMKNDKDYQLLKNRGHNYRNVFHGQDLFMLPRLDSVYKLNPGMTGYKEGNKWVYTYFVPHNGKDLINLLGGKKDFATRLDSAMTNNVILYDNETVVQLPYLFNAAGYPALTQKWIRDIMINRFSATPGGLPGNDDLGSMSSAYIFNAMGLFPISPGNPRYAIGAPLFQSLTLHLSTKKRLVIKASNQSAQNKYVKSLTVNKQPFQQLDISHQQLMKGGTLEFSMSKDAKQEWPKNKDPAALSETKSFSAITLSKTSISKSKVNPNEEFWIKFTLKNKGSLGTQKVVVYINGKQGGSKSCLVHPGETLKDSISYRLYNLGRTRIGTDPITSTTIMVTEPLIAVAQPFQVSELNAKPMVKINTDQQISYSVKNLTGAPQTFKSKITVSNDDLKMDSALTIDAVRLLPGEQKTLTHHFLANQVGLQTIKVNKEQINFKVYSKALESLILDLDSKNIKGNQLADASGFQNHGLLEGATKQFTGKSILTDDHSYVEIPNAPSLDQMEENLTMMTWVYPQENESGLTDMLTKGDSHVLQTTDQKTLTFFAGGWGRGDCTVNLPSNWKNQWHHLAGVCKGAVLSVYIDGHLAGTSTVDGTVNLSNTSKWQIGRNEEFPSERVFHGKMDKIKIYEQPLSADEITAIFKKEIQSVNFNTI